MGEEVWQELIDRWRRDLGPFEDFAVCERPQIRRSGFALLLLSSGRPRAFVKVRQNGAAALGKESSATRQVWEARPHSFSVPEPLGLGRIADWDYFAMAPVLEANHRAPRNPPLSTVVSEIDDALASLPRNPAIPGQWRPMHGDLTPWNLRELPDGRLILFDWEDAAWGPPQADMVLYRCTDAAVRNRYRGVPDAGEAARYWLSVIAEREDGTARDRRLDRSLRRALLSMQEGALPARPAAGAANGSSIV
jgi:hypothetical protein